jgi:hypothetical protein
MPKLSDVFPSKYIKASDLEEGDLTLTMDDIKQELVGQGQEATKRWVVTFDETTKSLVLNKTNAQSIAKLYGEDTDHWIGNQIILYLSETSFQGDMVPCIRVRSKPARRVPKVVTATQPPAPAAADDDDDNPPF